MHDGIGGASDHQQQHTGVGGDPTVLVATTVAALVLAGSAYIWKSGTLPTFRSTFKSATRDNSEAVQVSAAGPSSPRRDSIVKGKHSADVRASPPAVVENAMKRRMSRAGSERDGFGTVEHDADGGSTQSQQEAATSGALARSSRPKERRKRGKDPVKELIKGGKLKSTGLTAVGKGKADISSPTTAGDRAGAEDRLSASPSHSRVSSFSYPQPSTSRPQRGEPSHSSPSQCNPHLSDTYTSPSMPASSLHHDSRSRSRSRSPPESSTDPVELLSHLRSPHPDHPPSPRSPQLLSFDSLTSSTANLDAASTTSSASSSIATEATTCSSTSTAPSSLTSPTRDHLDSDRLNESDGTPKPEGTTSGPIVSTRPRGVEKGPWDWDGADELNTPKDNSMSGGGSNQHPRFQPKAPAGSGTSSTSEVLSGSAPLPYAPTIAKSSTIETPPQRFVDHESKLDEVAAEVTFPSLNNPESSSSASPYSTGTNSLASSVSRPQSRASSSSATSSKHGRSKNSWGVSGLAPLSTRTNGSASGTPRRAPTPREGRPSTPGAGLSSASANPPSPSSSYQSPAFLSSGTTVTLSAQTQLASLRGALEAARLREEKTKIEIDKISQERDALRWENATWRRREGELQAQIHHMMHQMQAYAHYVTSLSQHGQHLLPVVPPAPSTLPEESPYPQGGPSSINGQGLVPEFAHTEDKADAPPDIDDGINSGSDAQVDDSGPGSTSVPGDAPIESNFGAESGPTEKKAAESLSRATSSAEHVASETPSAETSAGSLTFEQPHPSSPPTQGPLSPNSSHPSLPSGAYPLLPFHPHSSNPQSPMGMQTSFAFSHLPYPGHIQGPQPQLFPIVPLGLSGIGPGGHMQTLQSPIHPGMMPLSGMHAFPVHPMTHAPRPSSPAIFSPSTPSSVPHPLSPIHPPHGSIGTGMGIGLMNGTHSSLWMNGIGPSSKLGSLSPDLGGPSSPISSWTQERGRRKGRGHSGRGMLVQDVSVNVVNGGSLGQVLGAASGEGQEENEGEGEPTLQDEDGEEDEEEGGFNVLLADAILKRPSSIRMGSSKRGSVREKTSTPPSLSGSISLNGVWPGIGGSVDVKTLSTDVVDASREETEEQQEFTFPSLSELGNVAREKRVNGSVDSRIALAFGNGEAARVSGASSPPLAEFISSSEFAPAALVPDPVPAPHVA